MAELFALYALKAPAEHRRTYYVRAAPALLILPLAAVIALTHFTGMRDSWQAAGDLGGLIMTIVVIDHGLIVLAVTPLMAAIQFSREAREKTFSVLLLAVPSLVELYVFKFIRAALHSYAQFIATIPLGIMGAYLTGIDMARIVGYFGCVAAAIALVAAAGLLASVFSLTPASSVASTYVLTMFLLLPAVVIHYFVDPAFPAVFWQVAYTLNMGRDEVAVAWSVGYFLALAIIVACVTVYCIPLRVRWNVKPKRKDVKPSSHRWAPSVSERFFLSGPRPRWGYGGGLASSVLTALAFVPIALIPILGTFVTALAVVYDVALRFDGARNAGEFDEIALTPLRDDELTRAFHRANVRASVVYLPAFMAGAIAYPLLWGTGISAAGLTDLVSITTTPARLGMLILIVAIAMVFGAAKYLLATSVAVRVAMMQLPFATRCAIAVVAYLGLLAAASAMSGLLPFAFAILDQLATEGIPSPALSMVYTLLATPVAAALVVAASFAVASETRTHQPWSRDYSFNR